MPSVPLHLASPFSFSSESPNPLPHLLQTPAGLAILEIQGTLHAPPSTSSASTETSVGRLVFPLYDPKGDNEDTKWMKKVYLYVGQHQRLAGEVKKLGKPVGVVRKRDEEEGEGLEIVEVVKWKLLFQGRPEPVDFEPGGGG